MRDASAYRLLAAILMVLATPEFVQAADPLPSWADAPARQAIVSFVEKVTRQGSPEYVAPEARIAVFDNDGTLWCEQPMYVQLAFVIDRVNELADEHPEWKTEEPFRSLLAGDVAGVAAQGEAGVLKLVAATHAGVTAEQFDQIATEWLRTANHPKFERPYLQCVYQPQLELLAYLRDNGFKTFIVSGGGVDFMRPWTSGVYGIPPEQIVGSSIKSKYELRDEVGVVLKLPELDLVDDKAGKPVGIHRSIGKRPIMAVGNSDGDFEMLEYVSTGPGASLAVLVQHDDAEREYAYDRDSHFGKLARGLDEAAAKQWIVVSMKRDWKEIWSNADRAPSR